MISEELKAMIMFGETAHTNKEYKHKNVPFAEGLLYLAAPGKSEGSKIKQKIVRSLRTEKCRVTTVEFMKHGVVMFSPLVNSWAYTRDGIMPLHRYWLTLDFPILHASRGLVILGLEGWDQSFGVSCEIDLALQAEIPIYYLAEWKSRSELESGVQHFIEANRGQLPIIDPEQLQWK